ncbi:endonuclease VII domain-containing protein [Blastococcus sp. SYSU DS0617]
MPASGRSQGYVRNSRTPSGFGSRCKACAKSSSSESYFYRRYGLTKAQVGEIRQAQGDRCAICGEPGPQHLDHDHRLGGTRQLLCQLCNQGLGMFRDDPFLLQMAVFYLEHHKQQQAIAYLVEALAGEPEAASRPGEPPVGSQRRPSAPGTSTRSTGRTSGARRREQAGEADT